MSENGMSASVELLREVGKNGLKVCEVPITCKYANSVGVETSTKNPVTHGASLIMSIVKLVVEDRPLPFLGIPGLLVADSGRFLWRLDDATLRGRASNSDKYCFSLYCFCFDRVLFDFNGYNALRDNTFDK